MEFTEAVSGQAEFTGVGATLLLRLAFVRVVRSLVGFYEGPF
jgi:hypothetical protein